MSRQAVRYPFVVVLITVLLMLVIAQPLAAMDNSGKVEVEGAVSSIDEEAGSFQVKGQEDEGDEGGPSAGYFCTQSDVQHPFGAQLAKRYEMEYADLQAWFCEGHGWGQIMLALRTGESTGADPADLLQARRSGEGWGRIWQELKLVGRTKVGASPVIEDGSAQSGGAGQSDGMKGKGKPAVPGQSEVRKANGKPDAAGQSNNGKGRK